MTRTSTSRNRRLARLVGFVAAATLIASLTASVSATHVTPSIVYAVTPSAGQWDCAGGTKLDPVSSGPFPVAFSYAGGIVWGSITITTHNTPGGWTFDFATDAGNHLVTSVLVKGGPNANLYNYGSGASSDTGLHSPLNPNNGKWYGLSHLCFYAVKK